MSFIKFDKKKIIHINRDDDVFIDEHIEIDVEKSEITFFKKDCENVISYSRWLLQFIKNFNQSTHFAFLFKVIRELYVNFLFHMFIKKNSNHVYLLQFSVIDDDDNEYDFVIHWLNHRDEDFVIIQILALFEIANDSACFEFDDRIVEITLNFVDSFVSKHESVFEYIAVAK